MTSACLQGWRPPESRISRLIKNMKTSFVSSKFDTVNRAREIERNRSGDLNWNQFFLHLQLAAGKVSSLSNLWASFELIDINNSNMQSQSHSYKRSRFLNVLKQLVKGRKGCWEPFSLVALSSWWCSPCLWQQDNVLVSNTRNVTWKSQACSECFDPTVCSRWGHGSPARRLNSPRPRSYGPGGRRRSLSARWVTGETSDCCLLCTIIQNTWIIITPEISNGQTEFYVYLNGVNCPFDESSHLCKVTCQFGRACFSPPFLYSPLPVTPPPTPELPFFPFSHVTSCSDTSRPYGAAILGDAYVVLLRKHASCQWSTRFATSQSLGLVLSHSSKNKLESGGRVSPLSSDSQAGPSVWAHQRVKIF